MATRPRVGALLPHEIPKLNVFIAKIRYPDILPKDTLPKDTLPKDILPNGHFADGHFAERTFCRTDILPNGHFAERTVCRMDNLPKIKILFRQNVWACDLFLNFVILNHCVK
jgi:hypothetical protein